MKNSTEKKTVFKSGIDGRSKLYFRSHLRMSNIDRSSLPARNGKCIFIFIIRIQFIFLRTDFFTFNKRAKKRINEKRNNFHIAVFRRWRMLEKKLYFTSNSIYIEPWASVFHISMWSKPSFCCMCFYIIFLRLGDLFNFHSMQYVFFPIKPCWTIFFTNVIYALGEMENS